MSLLDISKFQANTVHMFSKTATQLNEWFDRKRMNPSNPLLSLKTLTRGCLWCPMQSLLTRLVNSINGSLKLYRCHSSCPWRQLIPWWRNQPSSTTQLTVFLTAGPQFPSYRACQSSDTIFVSKLPVPIFCLHFLRGVKSLFDSCQRIGRS